MCFTKKDECIRAKKGYAPKHQGGAVMLKASINNYPDMEGINVYQPKIKSHFWLGLVKDHHLTIHHGFDLDKYDSEEEWKADIEQLMPDDLLNSQEMKITPCFFPSNLHDEDEYFFVVGRVEPTQAMVNFRNNLLRTFPHISEFSSWITHVSIASVSSAKDRDELINRMIMQKTSVTVSGLKVGFNKNR